MRLERMVPLGLGLMLLAGCAEKRQPASEARDPAPLTEAERRGRSLYHRGVSADGRALVGFIGTERVEMAGEATACFRCHGRTGKGTVEGGVGAPSLRIRDLLGRGNRYDEESLRHAIRTGVAFDGRQLASAMPRFGLSDGDMADLLAYLGRIGNEPLVGVLPDRVRIGTALPLSGAGSTAGSAVRAVLEGRVAEINAAGGILRRRVELVVEDARSAGAADRLARAELLAIVAPAFPAGTEGLELLERAELPIIAPLEAPGRSPSSASRVFFLYPGLEFEAKLLVRQALESDLQRLLLVADDGEEGKRWIDAVKDELGRSSVEPLAVLGFETDAVRGAIAAQRAQALLVHGSAADVATLAKATGELPVFATSHALPSAPGAPTLRVSHAGPISAAEVRSLARLASANSLPASHRGTQHQALMALELLEEALLRSGRAVSRDRLLEALESMVAWRTRDGFRVSFGPNRRIGISAGRVVRASEEGRLVPVTDWIDLAR